MSRPTIRNATLKWIGPAVIGAVAVYFLFLFPALPEAWRQAGSPVLYLLGAAGALLLLVSMVFVLVKRGGGGAQAPFWYVAHVFAASIGAVLVAIHGAGNLSRPPALLYLTILALMALGIWARLRGASQVSSTFGTKHASFGAAGPDREKLRRVIDAKVAVLKDLDASASEATFSLRPIHWVRHPLLAKRYHGLVAEEVALLGTRKAVPVTQAFWRPLHMALAYLFVLGVVIHIITVTFFAGYVADYKLDAIHWWHLTQW
jgi:hypothetical protein